MKKMAFIIIALEILICEVLHIETAYAAYEDTVFERTVQKMDGSGTYLNAVGASDRRIVSLNLRSTCNEALAEDGSLYMLGSMWGNIYEDLGGIANGDRYTLTFTGWWGWHWRLCARRRNVRRHPLTQESGLKADAFF